VPDLFEVESPLDVTSLLHRGELAITDVLPITELVFAAARGGDEAATVIIRRQAEEVAAFVRAAHVRLGVPIGAVPIVLGGSLLRLGGPVIHDAIAAELRSDDLPIVVPGHPPIVGAVAGAAEMLGLNLRVHELEARLGQPRSAESLATPTE
jgi:N-acetylglucosamine kinase-like BadF-type ATPase